MLGFLSTEQLADRFSSIPAVKAFSDTMRAMGAKAEQVKVASDRISTDWAGLRKTHGDDADNRFSKLLLDATTLRAWPDQEIGVDENKHLSSQDVDLVAAHAKLKAAFAGLPPAYRTLFRTVAANKAEHRAQQIAGLRRGIVHAYYPTDGTTSSLTKAMIDAAVLTVSTP